MNCSCNNCYYCYYEQSSRAFYQSYIMFQSNIFWTLSFLDQVTLTQSIIDWSFDVLRKIEQSNSEKKFLESQLIELEEELISRDFDYEMKKSKRLKPTIVTKDIASTVSSSSTTVCSNSDNIREPKRIKKIIIQRRKPTLTESCSSRTTLLNSRIDEESEPEVKILRAPSPEVISISSSSENMEVGLESKWSTALV